MVNPAFALGYTLGYLPISAKNRGYTPDITVFFALVKLKELCSIFPAGHSLDGGGRMVCIGGKNAEVQGQRADKVEIQTGNEGRTPRDGGRQHDGHETTRRNHSSLR